MPDIYEQIGKQIRELRTTLRGQGISQEELAWCQTVVDKIIETFVKRQRETASTAPIGVQ